MVFNFFKKEYILLMFGISALALFIRTVYDGTLEAFAVFAFQLIGLLILYGLGVLIIKINNLWLKKPKKKK